MSPRALIADDEPLLREALAAQLGRLWPELEIVAQARNGREAIELFDELEPDIVFLDVHMPGLNGVEAARAIDRRAQVVFVTAYEQYAVQAFEQGAIDYVVKPFDAQRLADTVQRLRERLVQQGRGAPTPTGEMRAMLDQLSAQLKLAQNSGPSNAYLQWIKAAVGSMIKLIPVDEVIYLRSDEKYTLVVWQEGEVLIRTPIRELCDQLDPQHFAQVHRSVIVNLHQISRVTRGPNETAEVHLRGKTESLPVSRSYVHLFRQM